MKRTTLLALALPAALALPGGAAAQLTMQTDNGWAFTFSGNVNAFAVYNHGAEPDVGEDGPIFGGLTSIERATRIRTGLLPGFAVLNAKGREGNFDLGVQIGFAPQINSNSLHDNFGAQIDMRQVFLTVGGTWGQVLAGRELGLYQRQNILTDMTLFGVGVSGGQVGAGGTTLGRIGTGYLYPNFNAQMTYSTPAGRPLQLAVGLFDPSVVVGDNGDFSDAFTGTQLPRLEAELSLSSAFGSTQGDNLAGAAAARNKATVWVNGLLQNTNFFEVEPTDGSENPSLTSVGLGGGVKVDAGGLGLVGSGYYAKGLGTTLMFGQALGAILPAVPGEDPAGRTSLGYLAQVTFTPARGKLTLGASYGASLLQSDEDLDGPDDGNDLVENNSSAIGLVSYQMTKSLRYVTEVTHSSSESFSGNSRSANQLAAGLMLFF